jgi:hypothetical protein
MGARGLLVALWIAGLSGCAPEPVQGDGMSEELKKMILSGNSSAPDLARQLGRKANPVLLELAKNPETNVRIETMFCLAESGGPEAADALIAGLADGHPQVAGAAIGGAQKHLAPACLPALLKAYDAAPLGDYRHHIALLIGRLDKAVDIKELKKRRETELDPAAQEGCLVAMARLGDKDAQQDFVKRLHASKGRERGRWLDHVKYIGAAWLLKPLLPILDDKTGVLRIGADGGEGLIPEYLRACDVATNLAAAISARKFTFRVDGKTNYTEPQLDEARKFLKTVP